MAMAMSSLSSCSNSEELNKIESRHQKDLDPYIELTRSEEDIMKSISDFSYRLAKETYSITSGENLCLSPISLAINLGIIANSTVGECREEIIREFGVEDLTSLNMLCRKLLRYLPCDENGSSMQIFNKVWLGEGVHASEELCKALEEYYYTELENLDFSNPASIAYMNNWMAKVTGNKIVKAIDELDLDMSYTHISPYIAINSIYFKGNWRNKFDKSYTRQEVFKATSGDTMTDMMHATGYMTYSTDKYVDAIILYFEQDTNAMIFYLPKEGVGMEEALASITPSTEMKLWETSSLHEVDLAIPKFSIESSIDFNEALNQLGLKHLTQDADLSPAGLSKCAINTYQNTYLNVDEEGTEAIALTQSKLDIAYQPEEIKKVKLEFNRPFIYEIKNFRTNAVLFSGVVNKL